MRTIRKPTNSNVLSSGLKYIEGNASSNKKLKELLLKEQGTICCYTESYCGRSFKVEIDHFNPTLKDTPTDNYTNWFAVSGQWNNEKSDKWHKFQPVLHPTATDLETRIIYDSGDYLVEQSDTEAYNLYTLLKLDDADLADERKRYINRMKELISLSGQNASEYFDSLLASCPEHVYFIRALKEEFGYIHPNY